jgi:pSer/pThr/pTyr-binding forkhead associated (FHA) protein
MTTIDHTESFEPVPGERPEVATPVEPAVEPQLSVRKGPEVGDVFVIDRPELSVGRDPSRDIFLNDVTVSREHATLSYDGAHVTLRDSGSLNGTYVNGRCVETAVLSDGDVVQVGMFQMVFSAASGGGS